MENKKYSVFTTSQNMKNKDFEIYTYLDYQNYQVPTHLHEFYELYIFINGQGQYRVENEVYTLYPGCALFIPPNTLHQPIVDASKQYERVVFWISKRFLEDTFKHTKILDCFSNRYYVNVFDKLAQIVAIVDLIKDEEKNIDECSKDVSKSLMTILFSTINRLSNTKIKKEKLNRNSQIVSNVIEYINTNFHQQITLMSIANHFNFNKFYLSHMFSKEVGVSIYKYITTKRILNAHSLLQQGINPKQACHQSGFSDYANFYRVYKTNYGYNPKACK